MSFCVQMASDAQIRKLEDLLLEATSRNEDLQRSLTEQSLGKTRLAGEEEGFVTVEPQFFE